MGISVTDHQQNMAYVVMGGTFDPIHNGHIKSAQQLAKVMDYPCIHMMPCGDAYHKQGTTNTKHRLAMLTLALEDAPVLALDTRETQRKGATYTVETLRQLRDELGDQAHICWVVGTDTARSITSWRHWQQVFELANVIVVNRGADTLAPCDTQEWPAQAITDTAFFKQQAKGCFIQLALEPVDVSSTEIRAALHKQEPVDHHVPQPVMNYIEQHGLYRGKN